MSDFFIASMAFPTVVYTIPLGLSLLYWVFVILGALDIDMFTPDGADGALDAADGAFTGAIKGAAGKFDAAADGAFTGALKGAAGKFDAAADGAFTGALKGAAGKFDAAADGALTGALKGAAGKFDAAADGVLDAAGGKIDGATEGALDALDGNAIDAADGSILLSIFNLRRAPVTVVFSFIAFYGWLMSFLAARHLLPFADALLPSWLTGILTIHAVLFVAVPLTSLSTRPLQSVFKTRSGARRRDFVGTVCQIRTGSVTDEHGQATLDDGGAGLIIQVRGGAHNFKRGERALIVDYDREQEAYIVEAYDALLEEEADAQSRIG